MGWGSGAVEFSYLISPWDALRASVNLAKATLTPVLTNELPLDSNPALLRDQDVCLVFVNADSGEGYLAYEGIRGDRNDLYLQKGGDDLIQTVARECGGGNGKVVVVVHAVGPVIVEKFIGMDQVKAVVFAHLLRNRSIWVVEDLSSRPVVFQALSYRVRQLTARIHSSKQDIDLERRLETHRRLNA